MENNRKSEKIPKYKIVPKCKNVPEQEIIETPAKKIYQVKKDCEKICTKLVPYQNPKQYKNFKLYQNFES